MTFKKGQSVYLQNHRLYEGNYHITTFNGVVIDERDNDDMFMDLLLDDGKIHPVFTRDVKLKNQQLLFDFMKE